MRMPNIGFEESMEVDQDQWEKSKESRENEKTIISLCPSLPWRIMAPGKGILNIAKKPLEGLHHPLT